MHRRNILASAVAAAGALLLILAAFNGMNLLAANLLQRQRETALRRSLGADDAQLLRLWSLEVLLTLLLAAAGGLLLAWWLVAVAAGGEVFAKTHAFIVSPIGLLLLFGWSLAFFYHLCSGIRHLAWDAGHGFEIHTAYRTGYAVLAATVVLTVLAWLYVILA